MGYGPLSLVSSFLLVLFKKALRVLVRFESQFVCDRYLVEVEMKEGGDTEDV